MDFKYFKVTVDNHVANVAFNRPEKANSLHMPMWRELKAVFDPDFTWLARCANKMGVIDEIPLTLLSISSRSSLLSRALIPFIRSSRGV